jgi:hypothetical protein
MARISAVQIDKKWRFDREDVDRIIQGSKQMAQSGKMRKHVKGQGTVHQRG